MTGKPDEYYIKETLNGNVNAYAFLVKRYNYMVFTLAVRIIKNREDAEEIAQDVFIKGYRNLANFKGDSKFSTWIYKIAYYASLDKLKSNKRQVNAENIDVIKGAYLEDSHNSDSELHDNERKNIINQALLKLSEEDKVIVTLYYFEELPVKEIVIVVGLSEDNVKVKLFRARKKLAELLKNVIEINTIDL
ncbi:RNA polymerase sigma factor [Lutibacter maritimus]|uniref:RNA polymerase sigma factor n=1 Tax=Lutibacter maritimus TaxID=593133 RepID=A0A1I6NV79_9FLAO|nr:sigma-70 family RNA polymerase sigma factor [Lutibacter maritimus]SFS31780.1 RNA polymerase, sigma subunit, ECF family [Lutibacter maritimus]